MDGNRSGSRGMPRLPARSGANAQGQARARTGEPTSNESGATPAWDGLSGPDEPTETRKLRQQVQDVRISAYRAFLRMSMPTANPQLRQVLYRLMLAERMIAPYPSSRPDADELALADARRLESEGAPFDERMTIAVFGPKGSGKTSLIHRLLDREPVDPFAGGTKRLQVIEGEVFGIPVRFVDTPGLLAGFDEQAANRRAIAGLRRWKAKKRGTPAVYLYVDRMDVARKTDVDAQMLRAVADVLGDEVLYMTTLALTCGASRPPDTADGPQTYETWSVARARAAHLAFTLASSDRSPLRAPTAVCDNHPNCMRNSAGEPVLPNNIAWRPFLVTQLLTASLILRTAQLQKGRKKGSAQVSQQAQLMRMLQGGGDRQVPITYILQQQNQAKVPQKFREEELAIKTPREIDELKREDNEAAREQMRLRREFIKERQAEAENAQPFVPTPAPDPPLPPTFDAVSHNYRYRYNESSAGWICRPFVDSNGPDHSDGINGGQTERKFVVRMPRRYIGGAPTRLFFQAVKDKENMTLVGNVESSSWIGKNVVLTKSIESQSVGSDQLYTVHVEPRVRYGRMRGRKRLKTAGGVLVTRLGDQRSIFKGSVAKGVRLEQRVRLNPGAKVVGTHVRLKSKHSYGGEHGAAYGIEGSYKKPDDPEGLELSAGYNTMRSTRFANNGRTMGGGRVHGGTLAVQRHVSPETIINGRLQFSSNGQSTMNVRVTSHDKLRLAWAFVMPAIGYVLDRVTHRAQDVSDF